jgi:hypothetical protein
MGETDQTPTRRTALGPSRETGYLTSYHAIRVIGETCPKPAQASMPLKLLGKLERMLGSGMYDEGFHLVNPLGTNEPQSEDGKIFIRT